ncbi:UDP-glycosyltransferase 71A15 [Vitis vinifera]|uniref:UDP-glycosyltransferase 71A15 n=1 Tax=Vitis vinifera TaxID=29760 RepID=A0A438J3M2_VITVI|nr:UDP-glycosyltransferase 71A15 [Vitis vinifera]
MNWLDDQPPSSVVFLCFGSNGFFPLDQVKEIAQGLECSRHRFLWSLRQPPPKGEIAMPSDYVDFEEALPQDSWIEPLELESLWYGVPIATWPLYSEQQLNAFQMVKELGLAIEIKLDYNTGDGHLVSAKEIENGIRSLMKNDGDVRRRVNEMKEKSTDALIDGGSSHTCLGHLIEDMITNIA